MTVATAQGTKHYVKRVAESVPERHFRRWGTSQVGFCLSSLGIGTGNGPADEQTDSAISDAVYSAISGGVNLIDAAIGDRYMRSERAVGAALCRAFDDDVVTRDEVWVMTKGGYIPFEWEMPANPTDYLKETYIDTLIVPARDLVAGQHCLAASFIADQIARSMVNLRVGAIDMYFLQHPEMQLEHIPRGEFKLRLAQAFEACEQAAANKQIQFYGISSVEGFRVGPKNRKFLDLHELLRLAESVAGSSHRFRGIQLPYNIAIPEGLALQSQRAGSTACSAVQTAFEEAMLVTTTAPLLGGKLLPHLPKAWRNLMPELKTDAQRALQFARSSPGILAPIVGMKSPAHVKENIELCHHAPISESRFQSFFTAN